MALVGLELDDHAPDLGLDHREADQPRHRWVRGLAPDHALDPFHERAHAGPSSTRPGGIIAGRRRRGGADPDRDSCTGAVEAAGACCCRRSIEPFWRRCRWRVDINPAVEAMLVILQTPFHLGAFQENMAAPEPSTVARAFP